MNFILAECLTEYLACQRCLTSYAVTDECGDPANNEKKTGHIDKFTERVKFAGQIQIQLTFPNARHKSKYFFL